ncbi:hypothetical protein F5Y18DRAFT_358578 [Xylariaceae sp. FL1019]|nr:hypothetical protein F5Y18DRAFT_358578 [Xylariaceae sp. FL1019]
MPRLPPTLFHRARRISPHLATLLPICRTIESAQNELRWIREYVRSTCPPTLTSRSKKPAAKRRNAPEHEIKTLVRRRGAGEPLQYILGSQPFGNLDIECRRGVLIPRSETEDWVLRLESRTSDALLRRHSRHLRIEDSRAENGRHEKGPLGRELKILDLCSGTGCIGLLLYSLVSHRLAKLRRLGRGLDLRPRVWGFDIEDRAVKLGRLNLSRNLESGALFPTDERYMGGEFEEEDAQMDPKKDIRFAKADIFDTSFIDRVRGATTSPVHATRAMEYSKRGAIDILVSNPPYISQRGFNTDTERSVRTHEPRLALVPPPLSDSRPSDKEMTAESYRNPLGPENPEDIFYARLLQIAAHLKPKIVAFEVGDLGQAMRVMEMALGKAGKEMGLEWDVSEIWCDEMDGSQRVQNLDGRDVLIMGNGNGRVVFLMRDG